MDNKEIKLANILLVEDNEGDIVLILEAFEELKIKAEINIAKNGQEALDYLFERGTKNKSKKPDLILLDINIPIYNGHEVLKQIKEDPILKKTPVIMLTTSTNQKDINKAYQNHCNSYVKKPLNVDEFLDAILKIEQFWLQLSILAK
ncbi:response regulator [uncultured Cyclobacterium sp.]|uniref:response regulator n=1 Tax=uncultured Cyclobacterium sp. TaxID=453820 RepID=UPI0030EC7D66|tara:strand:+ start:95791 stop:96231 length:441 start_codon:yes stop_codon:yes gene_type:complete